MPFKRWVPSARARPCRKQDQGTSSTQGLTGYKVLQATCRSSCNGPVPTTASTTLIIETVSA